MIKLSPTTSNLPTVTVVIPTHNRRELIGSAINSALRQTHAPHEIIVVDDASVDNTSDYLLRAYPNVIVHRLRRCSGACVARNAGIDKANSDYVAFLDSDDTFLPNKLEVQLRAMVDTNSQYATCGYRTENGTDLLTDVQPESKLARFNFRGGTSGLICEKTTLEKARFDPHMLAAQDWDLFLRLSENARGVHCPLALYNYGTSESNRITRSKRRRFIGHVQLYRKNILHTERATLRNRISHRIIQTHLASDIKACRSLHSITGKLYKLVR